MITRRRFLTLSAASLACPVQAAPVRWQGFALGAEVTLTLQAAPDLADKAIQTAQQILAEGEALFSLYDPASDLSRLNASGQLLHPAKPFLSLMQISGQVQSATKGRFDPTIQPLWTALAQGQNPESARAAIGWSRIRTSSEKVTLDAGQSLTFNGIAQGFLTDLLQTRWREMGLEHCLINLGEFAALGGPFTLGISDPDRGLVGKQTLTNNAIATSSPGAMSLGQNSHILDPKGAKPQWSTVSVVAQTAAIADAASTAFCVMTRDQILTSCAALPSITSVVLVARNGVTERLTL